MLSPIHDLLEKKVMHGEYDLHSRTKEHHKQLYAWIALRSNFPVVLSSQISYYYLFGLNQLLIEKLYANTSS